MKNISIISAVALNGVIGNGPDIPWRIPSDFKKFKKATTGCTILMGRKTFESIGRPLPKRRNIVITSDKDWSHEGVEVVHSHEAAYELFDDKKENFIIGGSGVYYHWMSYANKLYISHIMAKPEGDIHFPESKENISRNCNILYEEFVCEDGDDHPYVYREYEVKFHVGKVTESEVDGIEL